VLLPCAEPVRQDRRNSSVVGTHSGAPPRQGGARCSQTRLLKPKTPGLVRCWGQILGQVEGRSSDGCTPLRQQKRPFCWPFKSPLTDSNRRPPPYHVLPSATGRNPRQRFWLVLAASAPIRFATDCHRLQPRGSIKAPSDVASSSYCALKGWPPVATAGLHKAPRRGNRRRKRYGVGRRALPLPPSLNLAA
jgi:hypothetical protein